MDNPLAGIVFNIAATVLFSTSDTMAKYLSQSMPVIEIAWIRYIAFVVLAVALAVRTRPVRFGTRKPGLQVLRGLGVVGSAIFFMMSLRYLPMAEACALGFSSPLLITVLSVPVLGEVVGPRRWVAVVTGLIGVLVVMRPGTAAFQPAAIYSVLSSLCWSVGAVLTRRMAAGERPTTVLFWSAVVGLVVLTALLPGQAVRPTGVELLLATVLGVVASVGQYLMVLAYRHAAASLLAPFSYMQLIWSTAGGWLVFSAWPDAMTLVGAAIIIASGFYTAVGERRRRPLPPGEAEEPLSPVRGYQPPARP